MGEPPSKLGMEVLKRMVNLEPLGRGKIDTAPFERDRSRMALGGWTRARVRGENGPFPSVGATLPLSAACRFLEILVELFCSSRSSCRPLCAFWAMCMCLNQKSSENISCRLSLCFRLSVHAPFEHAHTHTPCNKNTHTHTPFNTRTHP